MAGFAPQEAEALIRAGKAPNGMKVEGALMLMRLPESARLPEGLECEGLTLGECGHITALPEGLAASKWVNVRACRNLKVLPARLRADAIQLDQCPRLKGLHQGVRPGQHLVVRHCPGIRSLPPGLRLNSLVVSNSGMASLGEGLNVGDCKLQRLPYLASFPDNMTVSGGLFLEALAQLDFASLKGQSLESLSIKNCPGLDALPQGLEIAEWMDIAGAYSLRTLPADLECGGPITLTHCWGLERLPEGLCLGGNLNIVGCPALQAVPKSIGFFRGGKALYIDGERVATKWVAPADAPDAGPSP